MKPEIETLTKLGLTQNQARIYLALATQNQLSAREISQNTGVTRQDVYRIIPQLLNKGLAIKQPTHPATYKATPPKNALHTLLEQRKRENNQLTQKTNQLLQKLEKHHSSKTTKQTDTFTIIPGQAHITTKMAETLETTQKTLKVVTSQQRFSQAIITFTQAYKRALQHGVTIKIAAEQHTPTTQAQQTIRELAATNPENFQVKYFHNPPEAITAIFDDQKAFVTLTAKANLTDTAALFSNNPCFIALAKAYFNSKWHNATDGNIGCHGKSIE